MPEPMHPADALRDPRFTPVSSSNIAAMMRDDATGTLHVEFRGGTTYTYPDPDGTLHAGMIGAESAGKFFQAHVRPLGGTKLEAPKAEQ